MIPEVANSLVLAAVLFSIGVLGVMVRRHPVIIFMCIELMLNAVVLNLVAFARFMEPARVVGKTFAIVVYATAAAEAALGLALIISIWRTENTVAVEEIDLLKG